MEIKIEHNQSDKKPVPFYKGTIYESDNGKIVICSADSSESQTFTGFCIREDNESSGSEYNEWNYYCGTWCKAYFRVFCGVIHMEQCEK